jgi:hypothetical protein
MPSTPPPAATALARAQRGVPLPDAVPRGSVAPARLTLAERLRVIDGIEAVIEGVYTHLPLKRARYGFDPVQRLRILKSVAGDFDDLGFHAELAAILTQMRDYHTRYTGPKAYASQVAVLPFLADMYGGDTAPTYVVSRVGRGLDPAFEPGVLLAYWNGVPFDRAVLRHAQHECAGRPDGQRAAALSSLTFRALRFGPPPDEEWVVIGFYKAGADGKPTGALREIRLPWAVLDPAKAGAALDGGARALRQRAPTVAQRRKLGALAAVAVNPAAAAVRQAKMLLFAPEVLAGRQSAAKAPVAAKAVARGAAAGKSRAAGRQALAATNIETTIPDTLRAQAIDVPGGTIGVLRIWAFDAAPDVFINELLRLVPLLPQGGLVIDVRGNPGGYIVAAESALQLFTPGRIVPTRFSVLATEFTRDIAALKKSQSWLAEDLAPWKASLDAALRNGEPYSQPLPITPDEWCNDIGQIYGGAVVLVADTGTYSSGDLFSAGFVDNGIGPFVCVGAATGAGGANVLDYDDLKQGLAGTELALPALPGGVGLSFAFRRATRAGPSEGLQIEDVGVAGVPYAMTRNDLLSGNGDLLLHCAKLLRQLPQSGLTVEVDTAGRKLRIATQGLDRVDLVLDGRPATSQPVAAGGTVEAAYPAAAKRAEVLGFKGAALRQRRLLALGR